jgi:hypothetical protein
VRVTCILGLSSVSFLSSFVLLYTISDVHYKLVVFY